MAMQTLQQDIDPSQQGLASSDHSAFCEAAADQAAAHAEEVRILRQRVVVLEAALASAEAARARENPSVVEAPPLTSIDFAPPCHHNALATTEFSVPQTPAVVAVAPAPVASVPPQAATESPLAQLEEATTEQPWGGDDVSFEERLAAKAFFRASTVDEQSRSWLLNA